MGDRGPENYFLGPHVRAIGLPRVPVTCHESGVAFPLVFPRLAGIQVTKACQDVLFSGPDFRASGLLGVPATCHGHPQSRVFAKAWRVAQRFGT